jgi:hypothetical protein
MSNRKSFGRRVFSRNYLFASFFGAAMIASSFAYFNYKFAEYKFIDFDKMVFFTKKEIFIPSKERYAVVVYNSNGINFEELQRNLHQDIDILAVDLYQKRFVSDERVTRITTEMNILLQFIQRFNIYNVPSAFFIKKVNGTLYKQDSQIKTLEYEY